jgi:hypothetical protein
LRTFAQQRAAQKAAFHGEFFPADALADGRRLYLDFFQTERDGTPKGDRGHRCRRSPMITNERQYRITKAWAEKFASAATQSAVPDSDLDPAMQQLYRVAYASQAEELLAQLAEYEALQAGRVTVVEVESLAALPDALIQARIAGGLTQKQLATRLGLKEQQVQRYEATRYRGVSLQRVQAVADALGMQIQERVTFSPARAAEERGAEPEASPTGNPAQPVDDAVV